MRHSTYPIIDKTMYILLLNAYYNLRKLNKIEYSPHQYRTEYRLIFLDIGLSIRVFLIDHTNDLICSNIFVTHYSTLQEPNDPPPNLNVPL